MVTKTNDEHAREFADLIIEFSTSRHKIRTRADLKTKEIEQMSETDKKYIKEEASKIISKYKKNMINTQILCY